MMPRRQLLKQRRQLLKQRHQLERGLSVHRPRTLLLWEADLPDHAEAVAPFVDRKLDALAAHASQFESTMHAASPEALATFDRRRRPLVNRVEEQNRVMGAPAT